MRTERLVRWGRMSLVGLALAICMTTANAQVDTGTILGTVTDSSGAVIPGASVTIINQASSALLTAKTTADGRFEFTPLHIGTYSVAVEAASFKKATIESVQLDIQQQALVNTLPHVI